jgi:hypothetical protein
VEGEIHKGEEREHAFEGQSQLDAFRDVDISVAVEVIGLY